MTYDVNELQSIPEIEELLPYLSADERKELFGIIEQDVRTCMWRPLPGPQSMAYASRADVLGYGGAAGGGKSDLMIGAAINLHRISYIFRREHTQMKGIIRRMTEIMGGRDGYNGQDKIWRLPGGNREVQFGSVPNLGDELNYQGQARDLLGLDEASNFLEKQVRFLMGWVRTTDPNQFTQTIMTFNPPTDAEGRYVIDFFAPWLDPEHPVPAMPGELRYFASMGEDQGDIEVTSKQPFVMAAGGMIYDFDPLDYQGARAALVIRPQSRTFIPSRIADNPFLVKTNYMATLQALPEPLRSQMLYGDFRAGMSDDPWQVIPTKWVEEAQARWVERIPKPEIVSLGVDVARGRVDSPTIGDDTIIARMSADWWFEKLLEYPGKETPDGPTIAALCIAANRDHAPIHIDVIGVGASPYDYLRGAKQQVYGINVAEKSTATDRSGRLSFKNLRSELWWKFREALDPANNLYPALPPGRDLLLELTAPKWTLKGSEIYVESREDIIWRIGRSPDRATALILAAIRTPKESSLSREVDALSKARRDYTPLGDRRTYDPYRRG